MKNKFEIQDIVIINSTKTKLKDINNSTGTVLGFDQNDNGVWVYAISVESDDGLVWSIHEEDLQMTGKKSLEGAQYTGKTVKVSVDPKTGEGSVKDQDK